MIRQDQPIDDYANLKGPSLLKKTLGLQNHRHSSYVGSTSGFEQELIKLGVFNVGGETNLGRTSLRRVSEVDPFLLMPDQVGNSSLCTSLPLAFGLRYIHDSSPRYWDLTLSLGNFQL